MVLVLGLIGCILAFLARKPSGVLLLVSGVISTFFGLLHYFVPSQPTEQYTFLATIGLGLFFGIMIEVLAIVIGSIICLASESKSK
jgi:hypothetical protein